MRNRILLISILALVLGLAFVLSHVERYEGSFIFVTQEKIYDPIGRVSDIYNQVTRNCSSVVTVPPDSQDWHSIQTVLSHLAEPKETPATPLVTMRDGDWFMVESNFSDLEPAIFLIEKHGQKLSVQSQAVWSGTPSPWLAGPAIRDFVQTKAPQAPANLIRCFQPTLEHFKS